MIDLGRAAAIVLFLYLAMKFADVTVRGAWGFVLERKFQGGLFLAEMLLGVALPAVLLSFRKFRARPKGLLAASLLVMSGVVLNRMNVSWFGMAVHDQLNYYPTWMEIALSLAFVTFGTIVFFLCVHFLPIFPDEADQELKEIDGKDAEGWLRT